MEVILAREGQSVGIPPAGVLGGRGGTSGGGELYLQRPKHSCTVHYDQAHYVPVSGGCAEAEVKGGQSVVGSRLLGLGGDADGGSGRVKDGGGWGDGQDIYRYRLNCWGGYCSKPNLTNKA